MNRSSHYQTKKKSLKEEAIYFLNPSFIEKIKTISLYESQPENRILESAINYFLLGEKYANKEYQKIQASQQCFKKKQKIPTAQIKNCQNKKNCEEARYIQKLFD